MIWKLVMAVLLCASAFADELVSTGVGLVRGQVVTSREVQIERMLEGALYGKPAVSKMHPLSIDSKAFNRATQESLLEIVVTLEARSFNVVQISPDEVHQAQKKALKVLSRLPYWKDLQVSPAELETDLKRKLQAKKFIQFREQSSVLPVTDADAERYFNDNRLKYGDLPFSQFKDEIKDFLGRAQVERRMKEWYDVLLNKYQVKNLISEI